MNKTGKRRKRSAPPKARTAKNPAAPAAARNKPPRSAATIPAAEREPETAAGPAAAVAGVPFPVVGIGSSAGGLEALEAFFKRVPAHSGMAYVVVQHLDPSQKGGMVPLLQRCASIPFEEAREGTRVQPDHGYVIPSNSDLAIAQGVLHVTLPTAPRGLRLPIDFFFRSLAEDRKEHCIGVVLSGMGTDGTLGLRAIKENAGAVFVQSIASAKFDGMPRSAIESGLADVTASADQLPQQILAYVRHAPYIGRGKPSDEENKVQTSFEKINVLLRTGTGNDFSNYKRSTIERRIERRMGLLQIETLPSYVNYLRENRGEIELLFKELLIGVTSFFRDPAAWDHLGREVLPKLLAERGRGKVLRAWVPGCSTGEEAYSLAILFKEALGHLEPAANVGLQIFATDLDKEAIETARVGVYPANIAADVSPKRLRRFFVQDERGFRVAKDIREMVIFAPQNVISDPPFTKLDILTCRNLLIYLTPEVQKRLIPLFGYALNPGGILFLGSAETVGNFTTLFAPLDGRTRIYRRQQVALGTPVEFPTQGSRYSETDEAPVPIPEPPPAWANLHVVVERALIQRFAPSAVISNEKGEVLYFSGRTGKYLEPAAGRANLNLFSMAREGLRAPLSAAFKKVVQTGRPVKTAAIKVRNNGDVGLVEINVERLIQPQAPRGTIMIVFTDVPGPRDEPPAKRRSPKSARDLHHVELQQQLQDALEEAQSIREEMQTSQEELKSANEELQSTNEELQSTNEELTTSKEEMQSLNEELQTVNHELQAKVDELSRSNNDMKNLLNSTDIATLFLDGELNVRRFTTQATKLIMLKPGDAGRPITDISTELDYPDLVQDTHEVLRTLVFKEKVVPARNDRWYACRILPYRTLDNVIDGVVITFTDVSVAKKLEATLRDQADQLRQMADALPNLVWGARPDGAWDYLSAQWVEYTGFGEAEQLGYGWLDHTHPDDRERVRDAWRAAVKAGTPCDMETRIRRKDGVHRWFRIRATPIVDAAKNLVRWYGSCTDIEDMARSA